MNTQSYISLLPELTQAWIALQNLAQLRTIRNQADFESIHALADTLADSVGDDENHPLYSLFEVAMKLIEHWETEHVAIPAAPPHEVLRFFLDSNNLKQKDLNEIASPTLISDILAGRREISKRLAKSLAAYFHVDIAAFI